MNDALDLSATGLVLHRDGLCIVLNKPAGMAVHGQHGKGTSLTPLLAHLRFGKERNPELVHRLDRDTSGCLLLGRHPKALRQLQELLQKGLIEKRYWAIVESDPGEQGEISLPLSEKDSRGLVLVDPQGKPSLSRFRRLSKLEDGRYWLELEPVTGRTHQLRVHLAALGSPISGDPLYSKAGRSGRLLLHARSLKICWKPGKTLLVTAPLPEDGNSPWPKLEESAS